MFVVFADLSQMVKFSPTKSFFCYSGRSPQPQILNPQNDSPLGIREILVP